MDATTGRTSPLRIPPSAASPVPCPSPSTAPDWQPPASPTSRSPQPTRLADGMHSAIVRATKPVTAVSPSGHTVVVDHSDSAGACCGVTACCTSHRAGREPVDHGRRSQTRRRLPLSRLTDYRRSAVSDDRQVVIAQRLARRGRSAPAGTGGSLSAGTDGTTAVR